MKTEEVIKDLELILNTSEDIRRVFYSAYYEAAIGNDVSVVTYESTGVNKGSYKIEIHKWDYFGDDAKEYKDEILKVTDNGKKGYPIILINSSINDDPGIVEETVICLPKIATIE